ncbi:MAG: hypothetical protein M1816_004343 [Peltula sp. TS41687]|nr:MAG: hypothetical protein M1816_004343 [Peltula sp. TS41687]
MASDIHNNPPTRTANEYTVPERSRFRFKSKEKRSREDDDLEMAHLHKRHRSESHATTDHLHHHHYHHHHHHHHPNKRTKKHEPKSNHISPDDPSLYDDSYLPNSRSSAYLDPDTAFRESLFDALADDEGAAFWEGVYGQPIHTYSSLKPGPEGLLERMTDEEYTEYVRAQMWEKSHQHIIEERERRGHEKKRRARVREETERLERERNGFEKEITQSLKRGEERRDRKRWSARWESYLKAWDRLNDEAGQDESSGEHRERISLKERIPWPVVDGKLLDRDEVESFLRNGPPDLLPALKIERVRWHPDKIQQKLGGHSGGAVDDRTMKAVTAVFQIVDRMWSEGRSKKG